MPLRKGVQPGQEWLAAERAPAASSSSLAAKLSASPSPLLLDAASSPAQQHIAVRQPAEATERVFLGLQKRKNLSRSIPFESIERLQGGRQGGSAFVPEGSYAASSAPACSSSPPSACCLSLLRALAAAARVVVRLLNPGAAAAARSRFACFAAAACPRCCLVASATTSTASKT